MSAIQVSIILAPHNGMDHIDACIESLQSQGLSDVEMIVVDNASTDGTARFVAEHHPHIRVIRSDQNLAYAGGNNLGASAANGKYLLFLNHDTLATEGFLQELVRILDSHPEVGVVQSRVMMATHTGRIDSIGAYLTMTGMWVHPFQGDTFKGGDDSLAEVLGACGACLMIRRELFFQLGGFDSDFVIYFEDADLSLRVRNLGYQVVVALQSVILHWGGATTRELPSRFTVFHSFKNRLCLMIKNLQASDLLLSLPIHLGLCIGAMFAYLLRLKLGNSLAIASALSWNAANLGSTLQKRREARIHDHAARSIPYRALIRPLPISYFIRTSLAYLSKW